MILQISKYYAPNVGGIERVVQTVAEGLTARGYSMEVVAAGTDSDAPSRLDGVRIHRARSLGELGSVPIAPGLPLHVRNRTREADLVHYHLPNPLGVLSHELTPARPTVVTYHSDIVGREIAMKGYAPLLRRFLAGADRIVTTSPNLLANSEHLSPFARKCRVIPPAIDTDRYRTYDGPDFELVDATRPTVLFVGRLSYYKGIPNLLEASERLDAEVIIAGDGEQRARFEADASTLGVTDRVRFLGYVSDRKLRYLYHNADVFVLPSTEPSEAFGIVQLEAMASGTPVVNTDLETGVPWVSRHGETGLTVLPGDADSLADAIEALLSDPERRTQLGANAQRRVETTFGIGPSLDAHERLYAELLE